MITYLRGSVCWRNPDAAMNGKENSPIGRLEGYKISILYNHNNFSSQVNSGLQRGPAINFLPDPREK